jgi:hypothetical protein
MNSVFCNTKSLFRRDRIQSITLSTFTALSLGLILVGCSDISVGSDKQPITAPPAMTAMVAGDLPVDTILEHVEGAITAKFGVYISANMTVDGRDGDSLGITTGPGINGIYTGEMVSLAGSSRIGGNGIAPIRRISGTCIQNAAIEQYMTSPEAFLGLDPGALDEYKVTNITTPFHGIRYITGDCSPIYFGNSSGILIVHNPEGTAKLGILGGTFKGLIIADVVDRISGSLTIIGGVVTLADSTRSRFGNGNGLIKYSTQVLTNLPMYCGM